MRIEWLDGEGAAALTEVVHALLRAEFDDAPPFAEWRDGIWARHRSRHEFTLVVARDGEEIAGCAWAYRGERGQWWTDAVAAALEPAVVAKWVGGHAEVAELVVAPEHRGRGIGRALLAAVLAPSPANRALLGVDPSATPALGLYGSAGWQRLGVLPGGSLVLGLLLIQAGRDAERPVEGASPSRCR